MECTDAWPSRRALQLNQTSHRHDDLLPNCTLGQLDSPHHHHRLKTTQQFPRRVGVHRGHRTSVTRIHGLEHVQGLSTSTLPDNDAVRAHAE